MLMLKIVGQGGQNVDNLLPGLEFVEPVINETANHDFLLG
jgi:hypothetical protein